MPARTRERIAEDPGATWVPFIASQACDLVCDSLDNEPQVEFILGRVAAAENANIAPRKSWRRLQLRQSTGYVDFYVADRWCINREKLLELAQDHAFELEWALGIDLAKWIGGRYARYPLPNILAERMTLSAGKQREWFKKLTNDIDEVRVQITPPDRDLEDNEVYNVVMYIIQTTRWLTTESSKTAFDKLKEWLGNIKGVSVQVRPVSADKFTYAQFRSTHHLDLDGITFGHHGGPKGGTGAEE